MPTSAAIPKTGRYDNWTPQQVQQALENAGYAVDMSAVPANARAPMSEDDKATMAGVRSNYETAMMANRAANDFAVRNQTTPTGAILEHPWAKDIAQSQGWGHPENYGMMDADNIQLAAANKPAAIRQMTQRELAWLKGTAPSLGLSGGQNAQMQQSYNNRFIYNKAKLAFFQAYQNKKGSLDGATDAWDAFDDAHFDPAGNYIRPQQTQNQGSPPGGGASAAPVKPNRQQLNTGLKAVSALKQGQAPAPQPAPVPQGPAPMATPSWMTPIQPVPQQDQGWQTLGPGS